MVLTVLLLAGLVPPGQEPNTYGTDPLNGDTDGDGKSDGPEVNVRKDPAVYTDYTGVMVC